MTPQELKVKGYQTPLVERMAQTRAGQASWAEPLLNRDCTGCDWYRPPIGKSLQQGFCALFVKRALKSMTFDGSRATACMDWSGKK
jgi:hypothetical protein